MITYAGIGSRNISIQEEQLITKLANKLSKNFICLSGNAEGSDIAFMRGSNGNNVAILPWIGFNKKVFNYETESLDYYDCGCSEDGRQALIDHHKFNKETALYPKFKPCVRNYHQVFGIDKYPQVKFVLYCADDKYNGTVCGGTNYAVKYAKLNNIPTVNLRNNPFWKDELGMILTNLNNKKDH